MIDIEEGIKLFNNTDFFAAHDFFEELWMNAEQKDRLFFQGMVQISVAGYHLTHNNLNGAQSQYIKSTDKLKNYLPEYYGVNLKKLLDDAEEVKRNIANHFVDYRNQIDLGLIPKIDFNKK